MISFLRNQEVKITLLLYTVFTAVLSAVAFYCEYRFGWFTLIVCTIFILIYLIATHRRYKRISELTTKINDILHGSEEITISENSEGELSVLQSEVYKMMIHLREQRQTLQKDKIYLADSIADISHQIRTPLTSINLLVSLISEPGISAEKQQKLSLEFYGLLSRIDWLITTLLKISKLDTGTIKFAKENISISKLLNKATAPLLIPIDLKNQQLKISASGNFVGDIEWTTEAITNILKNCMEHTPENGTLEIEATENALYTKIVITDSGNGIAKEDLPHIFERFYKGKDSGNASFGIGLALARLIITSQNGTVKAENKKTNGAKFTICFYKGII